MTLKNSLLIGTTALALGMVSGVSKPVNGQAATFSHYIRSHVWIRTTDGTQGGYHDKTTFTNRTATVRDKYLGTQVWRFYNLRKTNSRTYYANFRTINHGKKYPVKIQLRSKNTIWLVHKHFWHLKGNYTGNSNFGAVIFKRA
ncbi:hypothetical protein [Lentilactobacillus kisonensis]|uniref:Uncharacterized protein n=2 Tax=Lentilactobacillus kisonensis TaxID=481722 RepID=H1LFP4_9LACO|nr:hypothetical protein [Lentilactobacillus kisonensis]EHO51640.1 hypothetical protein HMPREF9104_01420 [Lentilactobacillus kisonensis F0435]KRL23124.1 hypothetical protein FC98_GL001162 [Lentilactobacillus kisonensis DSM 19906 = JCM 15041]